MSEPIQSISQGNYILHNIDAKKLYVQEPLFTANSGDAVYVGWRPDETVLWEGSAAITTGYQSIATNEPATAFNTIKIYGESWVGWAPILWGEVSGDTNQFSLAPSYLGSNGAAIRICQVMFNNSNSGYSVGNGRLFSLQGTALSVQDPQNTWLRKIVGINRKENA